ncbi:MAG: rod shape-determining protein MreD [Sulfuricella sp.]|nr:rod shape-determining protein MreD [Sulfuricella sp.]
MHLTNSQELLKPASGQFMALSVLVALMFDLLPWNGVLLMLRPDLLALTLLYWSIREPRRLGIGVAWLMGLMMDVADGVLFGQNALAYALAVFLAIILHRRILMFTPWQQTFYAFLLLFLLQSMTFLIRLAAGAPFNGLGYFAASVTGALMWPLLTLLLQLPQKVEPKRD